MNDTLHETESSGCQAPIASLQGSQECGRDELMGNPTRRATTSLSSSAQLAEIGADTEEPPGTSRNRAAPQWAGSPAPSPARAHSALSPDAGALTPPVEIPRRPRAEPRRKTTRAVDLKKYDIAVLYSLALGLERGRQEDLIADQETERVARDVAEVLKGHAASVHLVPIWEDLGPLVANFNPRKTIVFNMVESLGGRAMTDAETPRILQALGFRFTGNAYTGLRRAGDKWTTKRLLGAAGLAVPRAQLFRKPRERVVTVPLPAIVKPSAEGASFGITHDSVVRDFPALFARIEECYRIYRQPVLVEEFIPGREINVAVWGNGHPVVLPLSEIIFQWTDDPLKRIVSFDAKWTEDSIEYNQTPGRCPADLTPAERQRLEHAALRTYQLIGVKGFCRVDMRLRDGVPYILEVNANPTLAKEAGFFRSASAVGHTYESMILHIVKLAFQD